MSPSKIPRGESCSPCPDLTNASAKTAVDTLLSTVTIAHKRFGDPQPFDYEIASYPLWLIQQKLVFEKTLTVKQHLRTKRRWKRQISTMRITEEDYVDVYEGDPEPQPEDLGNHPRIVYTTQQSSPEVQALVHWLVEKLSSGDDELIRPTRSNELGDIDTKAWSDAWMQHATQHGFDDARAMLADDPLITRTMFDESRLSASASDKATWAPNPTQLAEFKQTFLRQASIPPAKDDYENVIFITPTCITGGPVTISTLIELDDAGNNETWCHVFNLLDWPSVTVPIELPDQARRDFRRIALESAEGWSHKLPPGLIKADAVEGDGGEDRLPRLSLQMATMPGNEMALLDYVARIRE
ncbi:related to amidase [Sporisorium scitamineum]|uniref:Related to amidase n=1 Tax=Sporisorium scitamineum TaxID=49012 RepID=A0A127ZDU1_9BASI|nr:related to amidase [Sporisorium scitamineum]